MLWTCVGSLSSLGRKQLLLRLETCSQFFSLHLTRSVQLEKVYFLLWIWRLLICCWEVYVSLYLSVSWRLATSVLPAFLTIILTVSSQDSFITTAALISPERFYAIYTIGPWSTFNASIHTFYLDGVDIGYPCFHDICSAIPEPNGCVLFHLFIRLVSSCDYLRPEHRHLEKVSAKNCSLSPKQSHANSAFNETPVNSICCHFEFFKSFCTTQHIFDVLHDFGFAHIFFQFFCQSYGVRIENSCV